MYVQSACLYPPVPQPNFSARRVCTPTCLLSCELVGTERERAPQRIFQNESIFLISKRTLKCNPYYGGGGGGWRSVSRKNRVNATCHRSSHHESRYINVPSLRPTVAPVHPPVVRRCGLHRAGPDFASGAAIIFGHSIQR